VNCQFVFLDVGNADSIIITPENTPAIVVDMPHPAAVRKRLETDAVERVGAIYFTHGHRDHWPALEKVAAFIADWLKKHEDAFLTLFFPSDATRKAINQMRPLGPAAERTRDAFARIRGWEKQKRLIVKRAERDNIAHAYGPLSLKVLHPPYLFSEMHSAAHPVRVNETSLVLQAGFGKFFVLLLADIEGCGLKELIEQSDPRDLKANVVKVPHHGAAPKDVGDLARLLQVVEAELAVLSVGSKNAYGHVAPALFELLLSLIESKQLGRFVCTEVTRTCIHSFDERKGMGKSGLPTRRPCAGDVVILADDSGRWEMLFAAEHEKTIRSIERAACEQRAELYNVLNTTPKERT